MGISKWKQYFRFWRWVVGAQWTQAILLSVLLMAGCKKNVAQANSTDDETIRIDDLDGRWEMAVTTVSVNRKTAVTFAGETSRVLVPVVPEIYQNTLRLKTADDLVLHRWSRNPVVLKKGVVVCDFWIRSMSGDELVVDWSSPHRVAWDVLWERPMESSPLDEAGADVGEEGDEGGGVDEGEGGDKEYKGALRVIRDEEGNLEYLEFTTGLELRPDFSSTEDPTNNEGCYPFYGPFTDTQPGVESDTCSAVKADIMFSFSRVKNRRRTLQYEYRGGSSAGDTSVGGSAFETGSYETLRPTRGAEDFERIPGRFNIWQEQTVAARGDVEAERFGVEQCAPPSPGEPLFHCFDLDVSGENRENSEGDENNWGCRCTNGGNIITIAAEPAFTYSEVPVAAEEEAVFYAPAQCAGSTYSCDGDVCVCSQSGRPVWKLTYRTKELEEELRETDGVVCPCDTSEMERWKCDPSRPAPCFFILDGQPVMKPAEGGKYSFPLRYFERSLRPVVYFPGPNIPSHLKSVISKVLDGWSRVLDDAVWRASGCERAGLKRGLDFCPARPEYDPTVTDDEQGFQLLVFCPNNPPQPGDPRVCFDMEAPVHLGDLRHNFVEWMFLQEGGDEGEPQDDENGGGGDATSGPLSFTPHRMDPLTGEIRSASVFIYDAPVTRAAENIGVMVEVITNENKTLSDFFQTSYENSGYSKESNPETYQPAEKTTIGLLKPVLYGGGFNPNVLRSSEIEDLMMPNSILRTHAKTLVSAGFGKEDVLSLSGADLDPGTLLRERVSPLTWLNPNYLRERIAIRYQHMEETINYPEMASFPYFGEFGHFYSTPFSGFSNKIVRNLCGCNPSESPQGCDDEQLTLTERWEDDPLCREKVVETIRSRLAAKLVSRGLGHNLGLRNNYKGSFDVLNYPDEYWDIRVDAARQQNQPVFERWSQPMTQWELAQGIGSFMTSSVMDYTPDYLSENHSPGCWDEAALNRLYTGFTPVYREIREEIPGGEGSPSPEEVVGALQARVETGWHTGMTVKQAQSIEPVIPTLSYYDPEHRQETPQGAVNTKSSNRAFRPIRWIVPGEKAPGFPAMSMALAATAEWLEQDKKPRALIPFLHCSAETLGKEPGCFYFDVGEEPYTIASNALNAYLNSTTLIRNRPGFLEHNDELWHQRRVVARHLDTLFSLGRLYEVFKEYVTGERFSDWGVTQQDLVAKWSSFSVAAEAAFWEPITRILTMPKEAPFDPFPDMSIIHPVMDDWDEGEHLQWGVQRTRIGTIHERAILMQMMGTQGDYKLWQTFGPFERTTPPAGGPSLARLFSTRVGALLTGLLARRSEEIAPKICLDDYGVVVYEPFNFIHLGKEPCSAASEKIGMPLEHVGHLELPDGPLLALYEIVYGQNMWPLERSVFRATAEAEAMFAECNDLADDGCERVSFTNPFTTEEYLAAVYPAEFINETGVDVSVGAAMLKRARDLREEWEDAVDACGLPCEPGEWGYEDVESTRAILEEYIFRIQVMATLAELRS